MNESGGPAVTNTTTETNIFSTIIPAGKMGIAKVINFQLIVHITTPALTIPTISLKLKFGTGVLTIANVAILSASVTDKPMLISGKIANLGVTNSQYVMVEFTNSNGVSAILAGLANSFIVADTSFTIDTTVDQTLAVSAQFGALSSTTSIVPKLIELVLT